MTRYAVSMSKMAYTCSEQTLQTCVRAGCPMLERQLGSRGGCFAAIQNRLHAVNQCWEVVCSADGRTLEPEVLQDNPAYIAGCACRPAFMQAICLDASIADGLHQKLQPRKVWKIPEDAFNAAARMRRPS